MFARVRGPILTLSLLAMAVGPACKCGGATVRTRTPTIEVTPNPVLFQPLAVGKSAVLIVEVRNVGNEDLHLSKDPSITEDDTDNQVEYTLPLKLGQGCDGKARPDATHLIIVPGDCAQVGVRYAPLNDGDKDPAHLIFVSDDPEHPTLSVPVGLGEPAALQVCTLKADGTDDTCDSATTPTPQVEFGLVAKGQSANKKVRLRNVGKSRLSSLVVYDPAGPMGSEFARSANAPVALDVNQTVDITVRFTPSGGGQRLGYLQVDSGDPARPSVQVPLRGIAAGPALCADPDPMEFGPSDVAKVNEKQLKLSSCGSVPVQLQSVQFDILSSAEFSAPSLPGPQTLQPGQSVSFAVRYTPQDTLEAQGALLVGNDGQPDQYVLLHGTGKLAPSCRLDTSVKQVDFGQVVRGQSANRDITVANRGALDCHLTAVKIISGASYFSVVSPPTSTITMRPGDSFTVTVKYAPPANDTNSSDNGSVEFDSDDPIHAQEVVTLTGASVQNPVCKVKVTPGSVTQIGYVGRLLQFGTVLVSKTKTLPVTIQNVGSASCNIAQWRFVLGLGGIGGGGGGCSGTTCRDYKLPGPNPTTPLAPGQSTQINVTFAPQNTNQQPFPPEVFLFVHTGDTSGTSECNQALPPDQAADCIQVGMAGTGDISNLAVLPSDLDFGLVTLGCKARQETISLYNTGTSATINIKGLTLDPVTAPFYVTAPPTPFPIKPQQKVDIQVTYKPSQVGQENASLRIDNDASNAGPNNYVTVALQGTGTTDKHQHDVFHQAAVPMVDLLFVMDNSGSMADYQNDLSKQAGAFINEALQHHADYHIGVTSTENDQTDKAGSDSAYPNDTLAVGGLFGRPPIIDSTTANATDAFSKNIKVGTCCSDSRESGLESAWHVLTPNANVTAPPVGSQGFYRDDARLVMVAVSDEQDQSHGSTAFYTDFFKQVKGRYNAGLVSFNAIIGDPGSGCNNGSISAQDGSRYGDVVTGTGGKWWSLCTADWAQVAKDLSLDAFRGRVQFALTRVADPATVVVQLNGAAQSTPNDYTFDTATNSVIFKVAPPPAAVIDVNYDALCF